MSVDRRGQGLSRGVKAIAVAIVLVLTIAAMEISLRLFWHNPYRNETPDQVLKLRLHHAGTDHILNRTAISPEKSRVLLRTDERSYILPSFQYSDPDSTIAFLGGSTTECSAVDEAMRFPALVSTLFSEQGLKVNTLNAARAGNTLHDSLNVLINHVSFDRPDVVVLMHASNDVGVLARAGDYRSRADAPVRAMDLAKWSSQMASQQLFLAALVRHVATTSRFQVDLNTSEDWRHGQQLLTDPLENEFEGRLLAFVRVARALGIEPVLMTQPFSGSGNAATPEWMNHVAQDQFNSVIRSVGNEEAVLVIDLVDYLQKNVPDWDEPMNVFYDAIHVNDHGSRVYAEHIKEQLETLVGNADSP